VATVVVSSYRTVKFIEGGGHFWVYMQYVQALRQSGCEVYWFERFDSRDAGPQMFRAEILLRRLKRFGLDGKVILCSDAGTKHARSREYHYFGTTPSAARAAFERADLLLNFHYALDPELLASFRRTALVDIDPGLLQEWMSNGEIPVAPHDVYFTTGDTVGTTAARFPDCGLDWVHIRPAVFLDLWPYTYDPSCEAFTTVTNWWGGWVTETVHGRDVPYENNKRVAYLALAELPHLTSQPLELAACMAPDDTEDQLTMERHGWRLRPALELTRTPEMYRSYIQGSRGELTCVKASCIKQQNGWISDRSLCYLATGKPVVMQDTGPSSYLPFGEGIFRFTTPAEAAEALAIVNADYERHCLAARSVAETYFDARKISEQILDVALT